MKKKSIIEVDYTATQPHLIYLNPETNWVELS